MGGGGGKYGRGEYEGKEGNKDMEQRNFYF